jgi:hypothetical protein
MLKITNMAIVQNLKVVGNTEEETMNTNRSLHFTKINL